MPRLKIVLNDAKHGEPRLINAPKTMEEFLPQAGKKLGLKNARYAYLATGTEVTSAMLLELEDDTEVYISEREGFYRSAGKPGNFKVALLGVGGVGKSCISLKYIKGAFTDQYDPSIEDAYRHHVTCDGVPCILEVLDTAGQEEYKCIAQQWVKKKQGFFLVYSIIDDASFVHLKAFHELIREEYIECADEPTTIPPIVLVGNKVDLASERVVSKERAEALAGEWGQESPVRFLEVSAKTNENIELAFHTLIRMMRGTDRKTDGSAPAAAGIVSAESRGGERSSSLFGCVLL